MNREEIGAEIIAKEVLQMTGGGHVAVGLKCEGNYVAIDIYGFEPTRSRYVPRAMFSKSLDDFAREVLRPMIPADQRPELPGDCTLGGYTEWAAFNIA